MAKETESAGSDRAELKKLLKLAADKPVSMAFALGADGKALIKMDKLKPPRTLEKGLKEEKGSKNHRFGTVVIDPEDPKVAKFIVNKEVGGIARKLIVALKGTGFSKVTIVLEDGSALEDAAGEEAEDEGEELNIRPSIDPGDGEETVSRQPEPDDSETGYSEPQYEEPAAAAADAAPAADAAGLTGQLKDLIKQMMAVIGKDPTQKAALIEMATDAQASIKRGDLDQAAAGIEIFRQALGGAAATPGGGQTGAGAGAEAGNGKGDAATAQKLKKSRVAWDATHSKIGGELDKLKKAILAASEGEPMADQLEGMFSTVVDPVLSELDQSLSDTLEQASDATGDEREELLTEARATIDRYQKYIQSSSVISDLDDNPFVPLAIGKTLTSTLSTLSSIMR